MKYTYKMQIHLYFKKLFIIIVVFHIIHYLNYVHNLINFFYLEQNVIKHF